MAAQSRPKEYRVKFPQDFIERVRESTNLVDIIGQYVQLRRTGGNFQGLCPFHNEKSPSFSVSEDKQVYHCFGCKASGNVFTFVQNYQGMTFPETIEYLAKRASIPLPEMQRDAGSASRDIKQTLYRVNQLAAQFFHEKLKSLPASDTVKKYLETRGLNEELVNTYKLGYAPEAWSDLADFFAKKKVPTQLAEQLGLLKPRTGGKNGHYDLFRHRLMFPIFSPTGECLGFGGRVFSKEQQPKYLNSPESQIFHKGRVFYGLDHSAKFIRSEDEAIVVEGYMDWLALAKVSVNNIVATLGTALTHDHAKAIKRYTNKVLLLFDGDEAGKSAAARSLPILLSEGLHARGLFLPNNLDPDEFVKAHGVAELRKHISAAPDLFDLVSTQAWLHAKGHSTGKIQLMDEFAPILAQVADPRMRSLYMQNFANMLDVEERLVAQSVARVGKEASTAGPRAPVNKAPHPTPAPKTQPSEEPLQIDLNKAPRVELEILNVMLMKEVYFKEALEAGIEEQVVHPGVRKLFQRMAEVYRQMPNKFDSLSALLINEVQPREMITRYLSEPYTLLTDEAAKKLLQDCIKRVKQNFLRSKSKELVSSLRGGGLADSADQLEQIMNIQQNRRSLSRDN